MKSDEQLVDDALAGNDAAFGELVERYRGRLLRFLVTRAASRDDAEDALQDALVNAYRYLGSFDRRWRFSTWLYRIAIREAAGRRHGPAAEAPPAEAAEDPLAACIAASERENLWLTARQRLPAETCAALWLHYVEDLSLADVGRALDRSLPWVKVALHRGRRRLKGELNPGGDEKTKREAYG